MRKMYDTTDDTAPAGADLYAGYVNGRYQSYKKLKAQYPNKVVVSIDVLNHPGVAQVLDIEAGDATPNEAPAWFDASLKAGIHRPTLYFSSSYAGEIKSYMGNRKFDAWIAEYGPKLHASSDAQMNIVAWQKTDHGPNGENIDISDVFDDTWNPTGGLVMDPEVKAELDDIKALLKQLIDAEGLRAQGLEGSVLGALYEKQADGKFYSRPELILALLRRQFPPKPQP